MVISINDKNISRMIENEERLDDRDLYEFRDLKITPGYINETADGSAMVELGDTKVLVGISTDLDTPYPDAGDQGMLITNVELTPMAAPHYEPGPPGDEATEIARVVDRGIRESGVIDLSDLVIEEGEDCYAVFIDIHVLDYDGNLMDAASIGAATALMLGRLPEIDEDGELDRDNYKELPVNGIPITLTGSKIGSKIVFDTTADEEDVRDTRLTVTVKEDGKVVNMQKGEPGPLKADDVSEIIETINEKAEFFRERIREVIKEE